MRKYESIKNLGSKLKKKLPIILFVLTPIIFLELMILTLNYTTNIWYYLKPKPIILTFILLSLIHILLTAVTRK